MTFKYTQYLIFNSDVKDIKKGKLTAQSAHASIGAYRLAQKNDNYSAVADNWFDEGQRKIALKASEKEILALYDKVTQDGIIAYIVRDFGLTQIPADTLTCMAIGPDTIANIEHYVNDLKLL
jgi:peptidyl-tRNA hydrolase